MIDVVCAVISDDSGNVLACQRPESKSQGGLWEFPGGKIEDNESGREALAREIHEELQIDIHVGQALTPVEWHYASFSIRLHPYQCEMLNDCSPKPTEHQAIRWVDQISAAALEWAPADIPVLAELWR